MTPTRVLDRTIKLLEEGWFRDDHGKGQALDAAFNPVAYVHPGAVYFTATGAVVRAIYELTGDAAIQRENLWDRTVRPFKIRFGSWSAWYDHMKKLDKDEAIKFYLDELNKRNRMFND